jgi:hypothetical protein
MACSASNSGSELSITLHASSSGSSAK